MIGAFVRDALVAAGLSDCVARIERGVGLDDGDLALLRRAPLPALAALGDAVRLRARGDEVRLIADGSVTGQRPVVFAEGTDAGPEQLRNIAFARLATPASVSIGVRADAGLSFVEAALCFGADAVVLADSTPRSLPVFEDGGTLAHQLEQVVRRCDRRARWERRPRPSVEQAS